MIVTEVLHNIAHETDDQVPSDLLAFMYNRSMEFFRVIIVPVTTAVIINDIALN